jgi:hypothetical protein
LRSGGRQSCPFVVERNSGRTEPDQTGFSGEVVKSGTAAEVFLDGQQVAELGPIL